MSRRRNRDKPQKSRPHDPARKGPPKGHGKRPGFRFTDRLGRVHGATTEGSGESRPEPRIPYPGRPGTTQSKGRPQRGKRHEKRRTEERGRALKTLRATVDKNRKGFAFLGFDGDEFEDAFVPPREAETLFHGDRVEVTIDHRGEVHSLRVIAHRFRELVGRYTPHPAGPARGGWVVYERKRAREEIYVENPPKDLQANDWVRAKLHFHEKGQFNVTAEITQRYGTELPASADLEMVAAEYNLIEEHSKAAEDQARSLKLEIPGRDLEGRADLREMPFITIDGETARDFDDAVFVERKKSGYALWVAIADVSHYVTEGSPLDKEALSRGTSVYFPERAFHMLPRTLSENLCSLRPKEPRLALAVRIEFDRNAKKLDTEVMEAVIESHRRATYNEIEAEWKANQADPKWEFSAHFGLYQALRKMRSDRGSIDFDLPEAEVRVDENGEVLSIKNRERLEAHRLIEEFMIAANEAVTEWMMERGWPFVYRVHEEPAGQSLEKFETLAASVGIAFRVEQAVDPKVLADLVRRLEGHPAQMLLNSALLRAMKQAIYSSTHGIHYGLASEAYTHFTSPIRRYPDLVVHRLLRRALQTHKDGHKALKGRDRDRLEEELSEICEHCSYRERLAADADREATKLKQVRAMRSRLGDEFDAKVVGMAEAGMFVQIDDPYVEGLVSKESITDDFYVFNEDRMIIYGRRKKRTFKIGDRLKVRCVRADIDRRQIDFALISQIPGPSMVDTPARGLRW